MSLSTVNKKIIDVLLTVFLICMWHQSESFGTTVPIMLGGNSGLQPRESFPSLPLSHMT